MKIVSAAEMGKVDRLTSRRFGIPSLALMENAGAAVAQFALHNYPEAQSFGVICGKGNNGGDGLVAARALAKAGKRVSLLLLAAPSELSGDSQKMLKRVGLTPLVARNSAELEKPATQEVFACDVLLDAMLGTGFRAPLRPLYQHAIEMLWNSQRPVLAVDVPSGLSADGSAAEEYHAPAQAIVTFTAPKPGLIFNSGSAALAVAPIGSPDEAIRSELNLEVITPHDLRPLLQRRAAEAHKGSFGHVLVIAGSAGKAGAAAMAGVAALRAGAGLVTVATAASVQSQVAGFYPELMTIALPETAAGSISPRGLREFKRLMEGKTAVAMGPGMGTHPETVEFIHAFVSNCSFPLVLDADALNAYAGQLGALRANGRAIVLTPHPGEMARLLGCRVEEIQANRVAVARRAAEEHDAMIVLKGHNTLVAEPSGRVWVNPTGNPGMAKGGTGDVLTGMLAGMLAQSAAAGARLWMEMPPSDGKRSQELEAKLRRAYEKKERYRLTASERKWLGPHFKKLQKRAAESEDLHRVLPVAAAVYLHGLAGDLARDEQDEATMLATDLLAALPRALRMTRWRAQEKFVHIR